MGTEIIFVIVYPVALICLSFAIWCWSGLANREQPDALSCIRAYAPLVTGFAVSMLCLALRTYVECYSDFTSLIGQGYFTESQRAGYLPARVVGQAIVNLIFVLPEICFVVTPVTKRLIKTGQLTLKRISIQAIIGWIILSLLGWLSNLAIVEPPYPLSDFVASGSVSIMTYGLPIPIAALLLFRRARTA